MSSQQSPTVTLLSPSSSLSTAHHVSSTKIALSTAESKPAYFQNPWKSYRSPSLSDAWLAYQKGAAIALPPSKIPATSHLGTEEDETSPLAVEPDTDDPRDGAIWAKGGMIGRVYVRPEFATVRDEIERDEWRDPPVEVLEPGWEGTGKGKGDVTWLGHASVLLRLPWKQVGGEKRDGACGVLFDPIFSYRWVLLQVIRRVAEKSRCSPSQYVGPARYLPPPCTVADLPPIHACCISHDHCELQGPEQPTELTTPLDDHLDYYTIIDLWKYHESTIHFFVPMGELS